MSGSAERVKGPGPRSVADNDGDSPALLATTATVRAFPRWPATTMATRRNTQLINWSASWAEHTWCTRFVGRRPSEIGEQEQVLSVHLVFLMVSTVLPRCLHPAPYDLFFLFHNG